MLLFLLTQNSLNRHDCQIFRLLESRHSILLEEAQIAKNWKTCPFKAKILFDFRRFFRFFYSLIFLKNSIKIQVIDKKKYIRVVTALTQEYAKDKVHAKAHQWHMQNNNQEKHNYDFHSENNWLKSPHIFSLRINSTSSGKKQLQNPGKIFGQFWAKFLKNTGSKMKKWLTFWLTNDLLWLKNEETVT